MAKSRDKYDWPKRFRKFFIKLPPQHAKRNRWFDPEEWEDHAQVKSFFHAADFLAFKILRNAKLIHYKQKREVDDLIYPMLYCYRHYIEAELKYIILTYARLADPPRELRETGHNIDKLWTKAKKLMDHHYARLDANDAAVMFADMMVDALHQIDDGSFVFRYSHDTKGNRTRDTIPITDVAALRQNMRELFNFFQAADARTDQIIEGREFDAENGRP